MARVYKKKLNIAQVCDKICELEAYIEYLSTTKKKRFANKDELNNEIESAKSDLQKYKDVVMEVKDV